MASGLPLLAGLPSQAGETEISVKNLSVFQKASQIQFLVVSLSYSMSLLEHSGQWNTVSRSPMIVQDRAQLELKKELTAADRPTAWRLLFNDAASYNVQTGKGGVNGSIILE